jgi:hypothetical protein
MPDVSGVLSTSEKQKIADWLNGKNSFGIDCPVCHSKKWSIADHVVAPSLTNAAGIGLGAYPYPQAMVISECGYTMYLNLVVIGIIPRG